LSLHDALPIYLAEKYNFLDFVFPVHLNPNVKSTVERILGTQPNVYLIAPLEYLPFVYLMSYCLFLISDSGGVQEEAPSLKKIVLVTRDSSERPEAINKGILKLVGTNRLKIVETASYLIENMGTLDTDFINPYGDGQASERILNYVNEVVKVR